jgi:rubrerythrin
MDIDKFTVEDLLLAAIKSEQESKEVYSKLAGRVKNAFLKDKLDFLAGEEVRHKLFLEGVFKKTFPGKAIDLPDESPVPLPMIMFGDEVTTPVSEVLESAMVAEKAAHDFYNLLADRFKDDTEVSNKLRYLAKMEMGHYRLLELEAESMRQYEDHLEDWPMMHLGP